MTRIVILASLFCALLSLMAVAACGPKSSDPAPDGGRDAGGDGGANDSQVQLDVWHPPDAAPSVCGNAVVEGDEACDDGNQVSGDGCNSTCTLIDSWDLVANASYPGDQKEPALACNDTTVAVAFSDWSGLDGSGAAVRLRLFGSDGVPIPHAGGTTNEFTVNMSTAGHQHQPRVALLSDGSIVVVWLHGGGPGGPEVRGRVMAPNGTTVSGEIHLASEPSVEQGTPAVAADDTGGFVAVWVDHRTTGPDAGSFGIRGRLFDAQGQPRVNAQTDDLSDFPINQITAGAQIQPDVAWLGDRFLVVWADGSGALDPNAYGIVGTLLSSSGAFMGPGTDFLVNSTTAGIQASPRIGPQPGAGAVVVWSDDSRVTDLMHYGIRGRLLALDGNPRTNSQDMTTGDFQVNTTFEAGQLLPAPAVLPDGRFAVAWQDWSGEDGSGAGIRARLFTATAAPIATPFSTSGADYQVNTTFWGSQLAPSLCATVSWFFSAWEDQSGSSPDEDGSAIRYRLLPGP